MNKNLLLASALIALVGCGSSTQAASTETASTETTAGAEESHAFALKTVDEVAAQLDTNAAAVVVFDVNSDESYAEHHVPGARHAAYDGVTAETLTGVDPAAHEVVFYCANESCHASHTAAEAAVALGYQHVTVMSGGIQGWVAAGKPVETGAAN
jgi:rhodanese-related sulfurtransferase